MGLVELVEWAHDIAAETQRSYRDRGEVWLPRAHELIVKESDGRVMYFIAPVN